MSDLLLELEQLLPQLPKAIEQRKIGVTLDKTVSELADSPRQISRIKAVIQVAPEIEFDKDQADAFQEFLAEVENTATSLLNATSGDDLKVASEDFEDLRKLVNTTDRSLRFQWKKYVERHFHPLIAIGSLLETFGTTADLGRRLVKCGDEANQSVTVPPTVEVLRDTVSRLRATRKSLEDERRRLTNDTEVAAFLDAVASQRATLKLVTVRVYEWLTKNGGLEKFEVRGRG